MKILNKKFVLSISIIFFWQASHAYEMQEIDREMFPQNITYKTNIPTPESFLGRKLGSAPVRHHELVEYLRMIANLSNRLTVETIGYSHERRPILFVVATSESNQNEIERIKKEHINLTNRDLNQPISDDMPVITWLNYGVHGAEASGMDAALPTVYYLAAANGEEIDALLEKSVILITAVFNPDGHSNRVSWMDTFSSEVPNPNPDNIEQNYDGRLARTNHYGFDLNRQWISITQPEPRAWIKKWHEWRPNLSVDYHEMGSAQTYYFSPGVPTRNHPLIPEQGIRLMEKIVEPAEAFLDSQKRLYFHGDRYDHFFLGKGSSFPLVNGGVGMLHEASSSRGIMVETRNGIRTYRENIIKHFRTSIANATGALNNRMALLQYQKDFYRESGNKAKNHPIKAYVVSAGNDLARLYHFVDLLDYHRIDVHDLSESTKINGTHFNKANSIVIDLDQSQHTLVRGLFDLALEFEDSKFYDVSTWTLPLAYGMQFEPIENDNLKERLTGALYENSKPTVSNPDSADYAFAMEWDNYYSPKALYKLLDRGLLVRVAMSPFVGSTTRGKYEFSRGSIVVSFDRQNKSEQEIFQIMQEIAEDEGIFVHSLISGKSATGMDNPDIGSQFIAAIEKPIILVVAGRDMDWYNVGEIWHLLDKRMQIPVTLVDRNLMSDVNLSKYTHIIYAGGKYSDYSPKYMRGLNQWVDNGGTLIGIRQGADWIGKNILNGKDEKKKKRQTKWDKKPKENKEKDSKDKEIQRYRYAEKESRDPLNVIGGAIFSGNLDITHPIGFGYKNENVALHKNTTSILPRPNNPYATVIEYQDKPVISGYASEENKKKLANTAALIAERKGKGSIILFADDPNFRATWYGTNKLFLNSLFFSSLFNPPR